MRNFWKYICIALLVTTMPVLASDIRSQMQYMVDALAIQEQPENMQQRVHASAVVARFYQSRDFKPLWDNARRVSRFVDELGAAQYEGLNPQDYHYPRLKEMTQRSQSELSPAEAAEQELLLTDALLIYAYHLHRGKVDAKALNKTWNYSQTEILEDEAIQEITELASNGKLIDELIALKPTNLLYARLKEGLKYFMELEQSVSFERIDASEVLKPGQLSPALPAVRGRLETLGFNASIETDNLEYYDDALAVAVKQFQTLHNLEPDGVIGNNSWAALNMSWSERIDRLRVNLERTRWVSDNGTDKFVLVNIAGYSVYLIEDNDLRWQSDVMIGKVKHQTPVFTSKIRYMEFNPTWTVPRSILKRSLIGKFKADPAYVANNDYVLYDRNGDEVDVNSIDWDAVSRNNFPYTVVQQPGKRNALGQVKFIFPNQHAIYLHDTPAKALFSKTSRAFSSGCVRVENPFDLAYHLLDNDRQWSHDKIEAVVASKKRTRVNLKEPVDVMLMYWTAEPYADGLIKFNPDVYSRDAAVLKGLNAAL